MQMKNLANWLNQHLRLALGLILGLNLLLSLLMFDPKLNGGGDNATYISLAETILHPAYGYSLPFDPEHKPFVLAPFGYPLLLSPLIALFNHNFIVLKLASLVLAGASEHRLYGTCPGYRHISGDGCFYIFRVPA